MHWPRKFASTRFILLVVGIGCLSAAIVLVASAGLPERAAFTGQIQPNGQVVAPEIGVVAPPFRAATPDGDTLDLLDLRGAPVIINFWATWCEPCRVEMPALQTIYDRYRARGLRLLAVNLGETPAAVRAWADEFGLTFDLLLDPRQQIAAQYALRGQPSTYVLSPTGVITHIFYGPVTEAALEAAVTPLLSA
ncbi:MAG: TlpA family protein disulfide reductase [Chloroflexi bacterium]|nr:TlpA family protein disulfide reductase [Chloroflexota bacterium]